MKTEYQLIMWFAAWTVLWTFVPFVAAPLMGIMVIRHFRQVRQQRKLAERAWALHARDSDWARMEGFEQAFDEADWWKRRN